MQCRFTVLRVAWEGRTELLDHECVGPEERELTCRETPKTKMPKKTKEPEELTSNVIQEAGAIVKVQLYMINYFLLAPKSHFSLKSTLKIFFCELKVEK